MRIVLELSRARVLAGLLLLPREAVVGLQSTTIYYKLRHCTVAREAPAPVEGLLFATWYTTVVREAPALVEGLQSAAMHNTDTVLLPQEGDALIIVGLHTICPLLLLKACTLHSTVLTLSIPSLHAFT